MYEHGDLVHETFPKPNALSYRVKMNQNKMDAMDWHDDPNAGSKVIDSPQDTYTPSSQSLQWNRQI